MGHWNYRLWKITGEREDWLELRETYYNSKGEVCSCVDRAVDLVFYEDNNKLHEILNTISTMIVDINKCYLEILDYETFKFAEWDK